MTKKQLFGICYVSVWVVIWGTIGSLVDLPFLKSEIYAAGSIGQAATFTVTAIVSLAVGFLIYPRILKFGFLVAALGLDTDNEN